MKKFAYKTPRLHTINLELKDFYAYVDGEFNEENVELGFNFFFTFIKETNTLQVFIHLRHFYKINNEDKEEGKLSLHHSDHLIDFEFEKEQDISSGFDVKHLAHLLGTSIIMVKGFYYTFTKGNILNDITLPVFNPNKLIESEYKDEIKDDLIIFE